MKGNQLLRERLAAELSWASTPQSWLQWLTQTESPIFGKGRLFLLQVAVDKGPSILIVSIPGFSEPGFCLRHGLLPYGIAAVWCNGKLNCEQYTAHSNMKELVERLLRGHSLLGGNVVQMQCHKALVASTGVVTLQGSQTINGALAGVQASVRAIYRRHLSEQWKRHLSARDLEKIWNETRQQLQTGLGVVDFVPLVSPSVKLELLSVAI